jgi:predicted dehydrogenase
MNKIGIVLVGIGGYGNTYVNALLNEKKRSGYKIAGVVDPYAEKAPGFAALKELGVPFFGTLGEFYAANRAELAVISTPIALHEEQALFAVGQGSHVLLEKPMAGTLAAARRIDRAAKDAHVKLAVGFQWCYDPAMLALKRDADAGLFGAPKKLRALVIWPRDKAYYARGTGWAGKEYDAQGRPVFDSVASNATAHYIENMLWIAGRGFVGAGVERMEAETFRAYPVETFDTVTLRAKLEGGAEMVFAASHTTQPGTEQEPMFEYEFENATARFGGFGEKGGPLTATFTDGRVISYGESARQSDDKIWAMLDAIREGADIPCPAEAALRHAQAMELLRVASPEAREFEGAVETDARVYVPELEKKLVACYENRALLSEVL